MMKTINQMKPYLLAAAISSALVVIGGCSSTPERDARLDAATAQYSNLTALTSSDPSLASAEMKEAQDALAAAQKAFDDGAESNVVDHKVYVAQRKVAIAEQLYRRKVAERSLE